MLMRSMKKNKMGKGILISNRLYNSSTINKMNQKEGWFLISILNLVNGNIYFGVQFTQSGAM